jgi:hypothetical protein
MMKPYLLILISTVSLIFFQSCKKCYQCTKPVVCSDCNRDSTAQNATICSEFYSSDFDYQSAVQNYVNQGFECLERAGGAERKEICERGLLGKALLLAEKTDLEFRGYTCSLK